MLSGSSDTGLAELDKLIHSFEFENQQYVKMIQKECQLINSLENHILEKTEHTERLEEEISHFDMDTKRLHRLYTSNRDNIVNLKSTISVMSDHELALSRQVELTRTKSAEDSQFYKAQLASYSSIRDDYMRKYAQFPLAIELEKRKLELAAAQTRLEELEAVKQDLKHKIFYKENELDSKMMTRIVVNIARTKLATFNLEKDIEGYLAEKSHLLDRLNEIQTSKQFEHQAVLSMEGESARGDKLDMDTSQQTPDCNRHSFSDEAEELANMSIDDEHQKSSHEKGQEFMQQQSGVTEVHENSTENRSCSSGLCVATDTSKHHDRNVDAGNVWTALADESHSMAFTDCNPPPQLKRQLHSHLPHHLTSEDEAQQLYAVSQAQSCISTQNRINAELVIHTRFHDDHIHASVMPSPSATSSFSEKLATIGTVVKDAGQQSVLQSQQTVGKTTSTDTAVPASLCFPRLGIPRLPRVPPLPVIQGVLKPHPAAVIPPPPAVISPPPPPAVISPAAAAAAPVSLLQDLNKKLSYLLAKPPLESAPQKYVYSQASHTPVLVADTAHKERAEQNSGPQLTNNSQSVHVPLSEPTTTELSPQKAHSLSSSQHKVNGEDSLVTEQNTPRAGDVRMQTGSSEFEKMTDENARVCDVQTSVYGKSQVPFKVNLKETETAEDKYSSSDADKSPTTSTHGFLLASLFGNFEKSPHEDIDNDDETAPTSIFSLFNVCEDSSHGKADGADAGDVGSFFTFGKFAKSDDSPTSGDGGPCSLLNLFTRSQQSDHGFAINLHGDDSDKDGRDAFKLGGSDDGKERLFSFGQKCESDEEGEKPLFLF